jgi:hypothetical protein
MARYYNLAPITTPLGAFIEVEECDNLGNSLGASGVNSSRICTSVRYAPQGTDGVITLIASNGEKLGIPFTKDNVKLWNGTAHGRATTYLLYLDIRTAIEI